MEMKNILDELRKTMHWQRMKDKRICISLLIWEMLILQKCCLRIRMCMLLRIVNGQHFTTQLMKDMLRCESVDSEQCGRECDRSEDSTSLRSWRGRVDVAKVLIQNGADVNAVETHMDGTTPCSFRWICWRYESVDSERCWCKCCDDRKSTVLHFAALEGQVDVVKVLIQNGVTWKLWI